MAVLSETSLNRGAGKIKNQRYYAQFGCAETIPGNVFKGNLQHNLKKLINRFKRIILAF